MKRLTDQTNHSAAYALFGVIFLVLVLVGLVYGGWQLNEWLEDEQKAPINQILITGQRTQISDSNVEGAIRKEHPESFFELDVNELHKEIEAMPWVYQASVRKRWPNSLNIHVVEEIASARWNNDSLLNQFGQVFDAQLEDEILPNLYGPSGSELTALEGYQTMQSLLNSTQLVITEMTLTERFAWNIQLQNGVRLNLGREAFADRLQRFVDVYPLLQKQEKQVDYIDLRYDTGLAVGWKSEDKFSDKSKQES